MEKYKKPAVSDDSFAQGVLPAIVGAFAIALAKGKTKIDSTHTQALTPRKTICD